MRRLHFDALRPVCPRCRLERQVENPLRLAEVLREDAGHIIEGVLHCSDPECYLEYPIVDGIPLLVANLRQFIADNVHHLTARDDLSETIEGMLGDGAGPGTGFDATRQQLSTYTWDHYADLDPDEPQPEFGPGAVTRCLAHGLELLDGKVEGPVLDLGCAVGRTAFALADITHQPVLGLDINLPMLRVAQRALRSGVVRYPRRRVGIVYDRREFPVRFPASDQVDFWACDALALPFVPGSFGLASAINVLDCVNSPRDFLNAMGQMLRAGGSAVLTTPYDWSPAATPLAGWIGGHSQRGPGRGAAEPFLKTLLTPGAHPYSVDGLHMVGELADVPWHARLHDRSTVAYRVHTVAAKTPGD